MPDYKNQHFVPRAHFKPFSLGGEGKAVHLYLIHKGRPVWNAPVGGQCSKPYFYGQDGQLEKLLARIEGAYATLIRKMSDETYKLDGEDRWLLRYFILLQSLRTAEQVARGMARMSKMTDFLRKSELAHGQEWDPANDPTNKSVLQELMLAFNDQLQAGTVNDLKVVIVRNRTGQDFVTSDDPAVMTNRWLLQRKSIRSFGFNAAGLILFLPLGPRALVLAYDPAVYSVPSSASGKVDLTKESDVLAFNEHQYMRAASAVYFARKSDAARVAAEYKAATPFRPERWDEFTVARRESESATHTKFVVDEPDAVAKEDHVFFHLASEWPIPPRWPSFLRYRSNAHGYTRGRLIVRRAHINDTIDDFEDLPAYYRIY